MKDAERPIRVRNTEGLSIAELVSQYSDRDDVAYAEPNYIAYASYVPNDPLFDPYQWNFNNPVHGGVHAVDAWDTADGSGAVVAIIDTGVAYEDYGNRWWNGYFQAPDLAGTHFVQGYDFVNNDTHANDDEGHGTHVAGTVAQTTNNGDGASGLAHGASIMPLKALDRNGSGSYADINDAIRYAADNDADVINLSLGGSSQSASMESALAYAYGKGVTIVAASGNDGQGTVSYPAGYDAYVIAVGATRYDETVTSYSNYGSALDIVAPGGDTGIDQNGDGYVDGILQQTFGSNRSQFSYYFYSGTSMATPHVAAAAAMVISAGVGTTPDVVRAALEGSADDLGPAGRDDMYGHGLLNVAAAVGGDVAEPPPPPSPEPEPEPVDNPPTVALTTPADGGTVSGVVSVTATSSDDIGVASVDFYTDGLLLVSDTGAPYAASWDTETVANGTYEISVTATDSGAQTASDTISVTVDNAVVPPPVDNPPTVTLTSPVDGGTVSGNVSITSDAGDDNGVISVGFYIDGALHTSDTSSPYSITWDTNTETNGEYVISTTVTDSSGQTASDTVSVTVNNVVEPPPPPGPEPEIITVFSDSFENGLGQWSQDSQNDWFTSTQRSTDGNRSAEVDGRTVDGALTSQVIDLRGKSSATIAFSWYIERRLDSGEYIALDYSTNGGVTWTELDALKGNKDRENTWHHRSHSLSDIQSLQIRFRGTMNKGSEDADVDNVIITAFD